ncbi:ABC transporter ATP-binding protein [Corynebacterium phoceense]|uniref:ABC transporter ATP-binding protein n=1 Tax=Corynebacterium phoceense TaxID=1686286 RepID=UPI00211BC41E|nr:ABC transporter ATP-binding protein [Corynebacterium phoceense]MCQ9337344.1 ABC transporter ATP-binding protein [Corynebacterium phoceense]
MNVLEVRDLTIPGILHGLTFEVGRGERVGLIGESGSGKSQTALSIMGLVAHSGEVELDGKAAMVFQEPLSALDPLMKISRQLHYAGATPESLKDVDLDPAVAKRYPHELSGGQRQRISIARALVGRPDILLADEAVSALDVTVRRQILELLDRLVDEYGLTLVFVTHDLGVVKEMCSSVAVVHEGRIVEHGPVDEIWEHPQHSYTQRLLAAAKLP